MNDKISILEFLKRLERKGYISVSIHENVILEDWRIYIKEKEALK